MSSFSAASIPSSMSINCNDMRLDFNLNLGKFVRLSLITLTWVISSFKLPPPTCMVLCLTLSTRSS